MIVTGLNAYHGDVAIAVVSNGHVTAAVEEERFARVKHIAGFPAHALRVALETSHIDAQAVDSFALSRRPTAHLVRKIAFATATLPQRRIVRDRAANVARIRTVPDQVAEQLKLEPAHVPQRFQYV